MNQHFIETSARTLLARNEAEDVIELMKYKMAQLWKRLFLTMEGNSGKKKDKGKNSQRKDCEIFSNQLFYLT